MKYSDVPISKPSEDRLGRAPFALNLATALDGMEASREGFVFSLNGEWGTGKTSVMRLICRYLKHIEMARISGAPLWGVDIPKRRSIDDLESMSNVYEKALYKIEALSFGNKDFSMAGGIGRLEIFRSILNSEEDILIADEYWQLDNLARKNPSTAVIVFSPWIISGHAELASALLSEIGRAVGDVFGDEVKVALGGFIQRLAEFAPVIGAGVGLASIGIPGAQAVVKAIGASGVVAKNYAAQLTSGYTLDQTKTRLKHALAGLSGKKILIVIDDIDRLPPSECLQIISLVKSLCDLPNIIIAMAYDETIVSKNISQIIKIEEQDFLAKIIQYNINLPLIEEGELRILLSSDLENILGEISSEEQADLALVWELVLKHYIKNPRDIKKFSNSMIVSFPVMKKFVETIDFVILHAIKTFEPSLYQSLEKNIKAFWGAPNE